MSTLAPRIVRQTIAHTCRIADGAPRSLEAGAKRCRMRSSSGMVLCCSHLAPRPSVGTRAYVTQATQTTQVEPTDLQTTYAASLLTEFAQRRHVDVSPILKSLRVEENEVLQLVQQLRSARRRGRDGAAALKTLFEKTVRILDSLNALEEPVRTLALRDPNTSSNGAALRQIRSTVHRAALRAFVDHSQGLPFARQLLHRMWDDARGHACVGNPDSDVLGMMVKKFRYAEENGLVWRLDDNDGSETTHGAAFQTFLGSVLSELKDLQEDIFTLIMDIHVDSGMSIESLKELINKCMRFSQSEWNGRWTPAAFHALMQAYRRDGDVRGCIDTYRAFRETMRAATGDDAWNRRNFSTASWPYEAVLTACLEARALGVRKDRYRPRKDMPEVVWRDIQADGVVPPARLLAYLIKLAVQGKDLKAAHRLWGIFFPLVNTDEDKRHRMISHPDMDCYTQYFKLVRQQPVAGGDIVPLRPLVRQLLESRVTAGQKRSSVRALWTRVLETSLSAPYYDLPLALWILGRFNSSDTEADGKGLAIDALVIDIAAERLINYWKSKPRGTRWTRQVMGAEGLALYLERDRGAGAGEERRKRMPLGVRRRDARSRGATGDDWDMIGRRLERLAAEGADGDVTEGGSGGANEGKEGVVYLPLAKPFARWETLTQENSNKVFQPKIFKSNSNNNNDDVNGQAETGSSRAVLERFHHGLKKMMALCIAAKPRVGINVWIEQAREVMDSRGKSGGGEGADVDDRDGVVKDRNVPLPVDETLVLNVAMRAVYRDLFGP